jgi:8-oxo-dGTP pyrophosphatase MutT (NUDIX family)
VSDVSELIDAASVLLLRDPSAPGIDATAPGNVEVFVVERRKAGAFAGVLAFPGGKVDSSDRALPATRWHGLDLAQAARRWGLDEQSAKDRERLLGWHVAAIREVFEEVGILLAHVAGDTTMVAASALDTSSFLGARARLVERGAPWDWTDWLASEDLVLDLGAIRAWSRWITPVGEPRRFDTAFFVAHIPASQADALAHDQVELVASRWCTPVAVLAEREAGTSVVIYPTRHQLRGLTGDVAAALAAADRCDLTPVQPTITTSEDGTIVAIHPSDGTVEPVF